MLILLLLLFLVYIPCFIHHILPAMRSDQADLIVTKHLWLDICEYELVTQIISEYTLLWNLTYRRTAMDCKHEKRYNTDKQKPGKLYAFSMSKKVCIAYLGIQIAAHFLFQLPYYGSGAETVLRSLLGERSPVMSFFLSGIPALFYCGIMYISVFLCDSSAANQAFLAASVVDLFCLGACAVFRIPLTGELQPAGFSGCAAYLMTIDLLLAALAIARWIAIHRLRRESSRNRNCARMPKGFRVIGIASGVLALASLAAMQWSSHPLLPVLLLCTGYLFLAGIAAGRCLTITYDEAGVTVRRLLQGIKQFRYADMTGICLGAHGAYRIAFTNGSVFVNALVTGRTEFRTFAGKQYCTQTGAESVPNCGSALFHGHIRNPKQRIIRGIVVNLLFFALTVASLSNYLQNVSFERMASIQFSGFRDSPSSEYLELLRGDEVYRLRKSAVEDDNELKHAINTGATFSIFYGQDHTIYALERDGGTVYVHLEDEVQRVLKQRKMVMAGCWCLFLISVSLTIGIWDTISHAPQHPKLAPWLVRPKNRCF